MAILSNEFLANLAAGKCEPALPWHTLARLLAGELLVTRRIAADRLEQLNALKAIRELTRKRALTKK